MTAVEQNAEFTETSQEAARDYESLLAEYSAALQRLTAAYTASVGDQEDLFQEIAIAIWQALPRLRHECSERTFVYRIAHNRAINFLARARNHAVRAETETEVADARPDPESHVSQAQERHQLLAAIARLPIPYRQVITLTMEGLEYAEIGEILGIRANNVSVRVNRARKMLRQILEK
jgi:RNA polymerase sigma-70 factor (ECF subfamily)